MKNMKRSIRRHHYARLKRKWCKRIRNTWWWAPEDIDEEQLKLFACYHVSTPATCSTCLAHMNPRVYEGVTLQEKRNMLSFEEWMRE